MYVVLAIFAFAIFILPVVLIGREAWLDLYFHADMYVFCVFRGGGGREGGRERGHHGVQVQDIRVRVGDRVEQCGDGVAQGAIGGRELEDQEHRHRGAPQAAAGQAALQVPPTPSNSSSTRFCLFSEATAMNKSSDPAFLLVELSLLCVGRLCLKRKYMDGFFLSTVFQDSYPIHSSAKPPLERVANGSMFLSAMTAVVAAC